LQLARAKEDAATAKSEASRSAAAAEFERDRAARLVSTLETQRQQMEGLMASNAKYQALITETERRLHAAQTQADEARDVLRRESMRAEGLQAEKGLLVAAERRLTEEAAGLSKEKYRLAAELEAARTLHAEREETLRAEALRAREEAARAIRELSDAQRELVSARYRSDAATRAAEHAEVQFGQRIGQLEEEARRAQDALSSAQQRASAAEAKVDLLQEAVRKAEERAARLEMERSARVPPEIPPAAAGLTGTTTQSSASIEGELRAEIKLLREELASAQEAAAAATGHAKQFELLARTAEEALKSVQADHEKFKREAVARVAAADEDATSLRASLAEKEAALREAKQAEQEFAAECERLDEERAAERSALQAAVEQAHADREQDKEQVARLSQDMETLRRQLEDAKRAYDAEVMAHGDALRRLSAADSALAAAQQRLAAVSQDLDNERAARQATESELRGRLSEVEGKLTESQRQAQSLVEQRNLLQEQLEKAAEGAAGDGGGDFANALRLLRREREAAEINLQLAERELVRLRQEAVVARRAAEEARAQLAAEMERQRSAVRDESGQEELLQKMEQFNLLRESNAALRADNTRAQRQLQAVQGRLRNAEAQLAPLQQRIRELEAAQDSAGAELTAAREESERWRKRAQQLMQKYESVDAAEYQRVSVELTAAQDAARAAEATTAERQRQLDAAREALAAAEQRIEAMERDSKAAAAKLSAELESSKSEAENHRKRSVAIWSAVVATCNRDRKPLQEWKALQLQKERRLAELEEQVKALQGEAAEGENSAAELAALRARVSQLEMELGAAQQEAKTAKQSAIDYGKRTAASKKAVESQLHNAKQQLAAAQEAEQSARVRVAAFESERENLTAAANALKEELRQCQEQLRAAKAHGGAGGRHGTRTAAAREAAKTQIAAIQQQAIEDVNSKLKRKQPPTEEQEQHEKGTQAVEGRGEQGQPAAELAPAPAAGQRKKPKLRLSAPTFTPSKGTVPSASATVEEIGPVDEQVPEVPIAPEPAAEVLDAEQPEEEKEGYVDHEMQPEEGGAEEEEHAEQPQSTEEAEIADEQGEETIGEEEATAAVEEEEGAEVEEEEQEEREGAYEAGQGEEHVAQVDVHDAVDMLEDEQPQQRQQEAEVEGIDEGEEEREEEDIEELEAEERGAEPLSPQHEDEVQGAGDGDGGDIAEEELEVEAEGGEGEEIEEGLEQQQEQEEEGQPAEETKGEPQRGASVSPVQQSTQQGASSPVTGLKQPRDGGPAGRQNKSKRRAPIAWVPPPPSAPKTKIPAPPKPAVSAPATIPGALQPPGMGMLPFGGGVEPYSPSGLPQGGHPPPVPGGMVMPGRGVRAPGRLGVRGRARGRGRMAGSNPPPPPPPPSSQS
jgi:nucleoprotein TPR